MAFPDYPFSASKESFLHHSDVLSYLEDYCEHFNLRKFIRFNTIVKLVTPNLNSSGWNVTVENLDSGKSETLLFDAIMVCNGHYSTPFIPKLEGLNLFQGDVIHSHDYRIPEQFMDKVVLVLGAAASGTDIVK